MLQNKSSQSSESGNVFLFILLAVVLFGALAFMISRGMRSETTTNMSDREVELATADIMGQTQLIALAVDRLRQKGCSEKELSFENPSNHFYTNASAPGDKHCHLFDKAGAGLSWPAPPSGTNDGVGKMTSHGGQTAGYFFDARRQYLDVGTTNAPNGATSGEITIQLEVNKKICETINKKMSGNPTIPNTTWPHWTQDFLMASPTYTGQIIEGCTDATAPYGDGATELCRGKTSYCRYNSDAGGYYFYHILLAR